MVSFKSIREESHDDMMNGEVESAVLEPSVYVCSIYNDMVEVISETDGELQKHSRRKPR